MVIVYLKRAHCTKCLVLRERLGDKKQNRKKEWVNNSLRYRWLMHAYPLFGDTDIVPRDNVLAS